MTTTRSPQEFKALVLQAREFIDDVVIPREDLSQAINGHAGVWTGEKVNGCSGT